MAVVHGPHFENKVKLRCIVARKTIDKEGLPNCPKEKFMVLASTFSRYLPQAS